MTTTTTTTNSSLVLSQAEKNTIASVQIKQRILASLKSTTQLIDTSLANGVTQLGVSSADLANELGPDGVSALQALSTQIKAMLPAE